MIARRIDIHIWDTRVPAGVLLQDHMGSAVGANPVAARWPVVG
jgi:hypothetical protein